MTVAELKVALTKRNVKFTSKMRKAELEELLNADKQRQYDELMEQAVIEAEIEAAKTDTERAIEVYGELGEELATLAYKNNMIVSKSPYGNSFYAHFEWDKIDWGVKPEGSFRLSDHWNWTTNGTTHCPTVTNRDFGVALAIMTENGYEQIA